MALLVCDWPSYLKFGKKAQPFQKRLLEIDQPETRIAYGGHVC
jgi:hypothetical protein